MGLTSTQKAVCDGLGSEYYSSFLQLDFSNSTGPLRVGAKLDISIKEHQIADISMET